MEGGSATPVSDFVNFVVGNSWPPSRGVVTSKDYFYIFPNDSTWMRVLDFILKSSSTTSDQPVSEVSIWNVSRRLASVMRDFPDSVFVKDLARKLVNMASCDKWLLRHFEKSDFDATWVFIICGLYQSLYLYDRTGTVGMYLSDEGLSHEVLSDEVLSKAKVMVLLLRWQHLQIFQRLIIDRYEEFISGGYRGVNENINLLIECFIASLHQTATQMNIWARDNTLSEFKISQVDPVEVEELDGRHIPLLKGFLANIFLKKQYVPKDRAYFPQERISSKVQSLEPMGIYGLDEDKWLWKYLHSLDERSNLLGMWSPIICALCQGLFLSDQNIKSQSEVIQASSGISDVDEELQKRKDGNLTILLFRSIHLQNFESKWKETWVQTLLGLKSSKRQSKHYEIVEQHSYLWDLLEKKLQESITVTQDFIKSCLKERSYLCSLQCEHVQTPEANEGNIFLGSSILPDGIKVEELLDIKLVHALGGLMCTIIEGDLSNNEDDGFTSWCIVRCNPTDLYFHVDVKEDEYKNKQRLLDETEVGDYKGMVEISTMDGQTTLKSFELDGFCYEGGLEDFADRRGKKKLQQSCAEKALRILPQSGFLQKFNLKCSVLHMFALAYTAGNKDYLKLTWRGNAGHVEYVEDSSGFKYGSLGQSQGTGNCALQKCSVLYTHEGRLIGEDIIWEGGAQRGKKSGDQNGGRLIGKDIIWEGGAQRGKKSQDQNGEGLKVCEHKTETTIEEREKVQIITKHYASYVQRSVIQDTVIMGEDKIIAGLIEAREEAEKALLVPADTASAFANLKQSTGLGVGAAGVKIEGHHEGRPRAANVGIKKFLQGESVVKEHLKKTVVVPPDLYQCIVDDLQARLRSGAIAEHPREFFVVKTRGSCSLQVFLCNPLDFTQGFYWLTDIVVSDKNVAENIFKDKLKGKTLTIVRTDSEMTIDLDTPTGNLLSRFIQPVQKWFPKKQRVVTEETMIPLCKLENFPHNNDDWRYIVGERRKYNKGDYYLKAEECQAIVCSGTVFTTGGALVRSMKQRLDSSQPSTSTSSGAAQQWLFHGSCEKVCTPRFRIGDDKVTATGKFSTFKGIKNWPDVYWG